MRCRLRNDSESEHANRSKSISSDIEEISGRRTSTNRSSGKSFLRESHERKDTTGKETEERAEDEEEVNGNAQEEDGIGCGIYGARHDVNSTEFSIFTPYEASAPSIADKSTPFIRLGRRQKRSGGIFYGTGKK